MAAPIRNPFYVLLVLASGALLITMLIYLVGWYYVPNPDQPDLVLPPMPPWVKWIDRHALWLIIGEVSAILLLSVLTIGLDRFFDPEAVPAGDDAVDQEGETLSEADSISRNTTITNLSGLEASPEQSRAAESDMETNASHRIQ